VYTRLGNTGCQSADSRGLHGYGDPQPPPRSAGPRRRRRPALLPPGDGVGQHFLGHGERVPGRNLRRAGRPRSTATPGAKTSRWRPRCTTAPVVGACAARRPPQVEVVCAQGFGDADLQLHHYLPICRLSICNVETQSRGQVPPPRAADVLISRARQSSACSRGTVRDRPVNRSSSRSRCPPCWWQYSLSAVAVTDPPPRNDRPSDHQHRQAFVTVQLQLS